VLETNPAAEEVAMVVAVVELRVVEETLDVMVDKVIDRRRV
jgi:hypothetical protein